MFPEANTSQAIIDCLIHEIEKYKVQLRLNSTIEKIEPAENKFKLLYSSGVTEEVDFVMLACGGFSKISQFDWLQIR